MLMDLKEELLDFRQTEFHVALEAVNGLDEHMPKDGAWQQDRWSAHGFSEWHHTLSGAVFNIRALPNGQFLLCGSPEDSMPVSPLSLLEVGDGRTVRVVEADYDVPETDIFREALQANLRG